MVKRVVISFFLTVSLGGVSCLNNGAKLLEDRNSSFSVDSMYYEKNYRSVKITGTPTLIDTNALYIQNYYLFGPNRVKYNRNEDVHVFILRFYTNGSVNDFSMPFTKDLNNPDEFNPDKSGEKGICFYENEDWYIDILAKSSELNTKGIYRYKIIEMSQDSLKLIRVGVKESSVYVYSKKKIVNDSILKFNANW